MKRIFLYSFLLISIGELVAITTDMEWLTHICKPLIMLTLGFYYVSAVAREDRSATLIGAVLLSCAGDTLLMFANDGNAFFMYGLLAFMVSHVLYILTYRQHQNEETDNRLRGIHRVRFAFPIVLAGTGLMIVLYPVLGDLKFPVLIYTLVLVFMALSALFRYGRTNTTSFALVFGGAVLFVISDSILAINKFLEPIRGSVFLIMFTYIVAQYCIVQGLLVHRLSVNHN